PTPAPTPTPAILHFRPRQSGANPRSAGPKLQDRAAEAGAQGGTCKIAGEAAGKSGRSPPHQLARPAIMKLAVPAVRFVAANFMIDAV
ncbi:hypothetical protein KBX35_17540, partial [Micromonospora sp. C32]|uniref:hypothetical protein n=1 Tax=Micromonospora sp. C32 TaxID=2824877 RepID=UPI001B36446C